MVGKHRRHVDLHAVGFGRWVLVVLGLWTLLATLVQTAPRYQLLPGILIAFGLMIAGLVPNERRAMMRKFVGGSAAGLVVMAGVVASVSIDEAIALLAYAAVLKLMAPLFRERVKSVSVEGRHRVAARPDNPVVTPNDAKPPTHRQPQRRLTTSDACQGGDRHVGHLPELRHHLLPLQST